MMKRVHLPWLLVLLCCSFIAVDAYATDRREDDSNILPDFLPEVIRKKALQSYRYTVAYSGKRQGIVKAFDKQGKEVLVAGFKRQKLEGFWQTPAESGQFHNGLPDGEWTYYNEQGSISAVRQYDAGKLVAVSRELKYYNPKRIQFKVSRLVHAQREDLRNVLMAHNEMSGLTPPFQLALHHGEFINFYAGGQVKDSCAYREGLRDGMFVSYHSNGNMQAHGYYLYGQQHGAWTMYDSAGRLLEMAEWRHGRKLFTKTYFAENSLSE